MTPSTTIVDGGLVHRGRRGSRSTTPVAARTGRSQLPEALQVSSDVFFYNVGAMLTGEGNGAAAEVGGRARDRPADRDRPAGRGGRAAADARLAKQALQGGPEPRLPRRGDDHLRRGPDRPAVDGGRQRQPRRSARATSKPTRSRWRSPTRRSPTAATSCARTSGCEVQDPRGGVVQEIDPAPQRHLDINPSTSRRSSTASTWRPSRRAGRRIAVFGNFPVADGRQDGNGRARARQADQSWYVALAPVPEPRDRRRDDDRAGRLRSRSRRAGRAPDPRRLLQHPQAGRQVRGRKGSLAGIDPGPRPGAAAGNPY